MISLFDKSYANVEGNRPFGNVIGRRCNEKHGNRKPTSRLSDKRKTVSGKCYKNGRNRHKATRKEPKTRFFQRSSQGTFQTRKKVECSKRCATCTWYLPSAVKTCVSSTWSIPLQNKQVERELKLSGTGLAILHHNSRCLGLLQRPSLFEERSKRAWRLQLMRPFLSRWRRPKSICKTSAVRCPLASIF